MKGQLYSLNLNQQKMVVFIALTKKALFKIVLHGKSTNTIWVI